MNVTIDPTNQGKISTNLIFKKVSWPPIILLVISNLVPLFGVIFLHWTAGLIILVYWFENLIIGFFNILKMNKASGPINWAEANTEEITINGKTIEPNQSKVVLIKFFISNYILFCLLHGIFLAVMIFAGIINIPKFNLAMILFPAISLIISHGYSYFANFIGKKEYTQVAPYNQLFKPYSRVMIFQVVIIFTWFAIGNRIDSSIFAVCLLVGIKILIDVLSHIFEHKSYNNVNITQAP